ncbi:MAG: NADH-quinone oxidoreductase subunit NuoF [Candidatus Riflebacteria bacterium]|nr:NADH-quinone oxidoreductase subunit NuoF [Candidatus Riflebacteria bacterium]
MSEPMKTLLAPDRNPSLEKYLARGGYASYQELFKKSPKEVVDMVSTSGLRGRGGAGFPTGRKWSFIPEKSQRPKYVVCNADEGEPGTFKDREILEGNPHLLIEGMVACGYAIGSNQGYIYIRGEFYAGYLRCVEAVKEARAKGYLGQSINGKFAFDIIVHRGAGAYICGEETALLDSLEGERGQPRLKPPFPAVEGLFRGPTVVNNVETFASVPLLLINGLDWYKSFGSPNNYGPKLFAISGNVTKPGVYELPMGISFKDFIYKTAGGLPKGRTLKAVIPGGSSTSLLLPKQIDIPLDYDSIAKAGSSLGSAAIIVIDDSNCMVMTAKILTEFYHHESCGKCTPCREGLSWIEQIYHRLESGQGKASDIPLLLDLCDQIVGNTFCPLADGAVPIIHDTIIHFRSEYEAHIAGKCCEQKH